jgi:hypothetical protein
MKELPLIQIAASVIKKGYIKSNWPLSQNGYEKEKRAYIAWDGRDTNSSDESENEVADSYFMANHEENEVNSLES